MSNKAATLQCENKTMELPVLSGTLGPDVVDVSAVNKENLFTYDPGFMSTASCESKITYIDGDKGVLLYRGYPIDQLANKCSFIEVAYLLLFGELPVANQKADFDRELSNHIMLNERIYRFFDNFPRDAHPMAMLLSVVGGLSAFYPEKIDLNNPEQRLFAAYRLIGQIPALSAMCYRTSKGQRFARPQQNMSYVQNFLYMLFGDPSEPAEPNPVFVKALDKIFTLHADHEQNASTSTVRMAGSTGANPYASIAAGISALWGPAHGGANEACLKMLQKIGDESQIDHYITRAKDKNDPFRLMGFGHRVYKNYDPRAKVMRETCYAVLEELGEQDNPLLKLAMKLEKIALEDAYFVERKLYPNVDFYSGVTLSALGIPTNMFTVIFALARTVGWLANWLEMLSDPDHKLARPRQLYTGSRERQV